MAATDSNQLSTARNHSFEALMEAPHTANVRAPQEVGPHAYALLCDGDCMSPSIRHGEAVICDPDQQPKVGDFVAIWWKNSERPPAVKRLCLAVPPREFWSAGELTGVLVVEQINPQKRLSASLDEVDRIHKIVHVVESEPGH